MGMVFTFYLYAQRQQGKSFDGIIGSPAIFAREYVVGAGHIAFLLGMTLRFWVF